MAYTKSVLVGAAVALVATAAVGQPPFPFTSASSLSVEPSTGQVAFIRNGQLLVWDGLAERVVLASVDPGFAVTDFAGGHILLTLGECEYTVSETRVVDVTGREVARLTASREMSAFPGPGSVLSLDGNAVWTYRAVNAELRRQVKISSDIPDHALVLLSRDLLSGEGTTRILDLDPDKTLPLPIIREIYLVTPTDVLMTFSPGNLLYLTRQGVRWQHAAQGGPWALFSVHPRLGLAAVRDGRGNLRLLRLADGAEQRAWLFADDPAPLERLLRAALGAEGLQGEIHKATALRRSQWAGSAESKPLWSLTGAFFLANGALAARFGASGVLVLPDRQEPLAELVTVEAALGHSPPPQYLHWLRFQLFRWGEAWSAMYFSRGEYRQVPPRLLPAVLTKWEAAAGMPPSGN